MYPSLQTKLQRFEEIEQMLQDPAVLSDVDRMLALQREHGGLRKVVERAF